MPYQCIFCGATSNRKNRPFDSPDAVIGHINAKRDDVHEGEDGEDYREEINEVEADPPGLINNTNPPTGETDEEALVTEKKASSQLADDDESDDSDTSDSEIAFESEEEFSDTLHEVEVGAHGDGYQGGVEASFDVGETNTSSSVNDPTCPDCGGPLAYGLEGQEFILESGDSVVLEATDGYCTSCDAVTDGDGNHYQGGGNEKSGSKSGSAGVVLGTVIAFIAAILVFSSTKDQQDDSEEINMV